MDDRRRDELHDALDEAEFAVEGFDVAGERGVFGVAVAGGGGARADGRGAGDLGARRRWRQAGATRAIAAVRRIAELNAW